MNLFFGAGFVLDGRAEPRFERNPAGDSRFDWIGLPPVAIFRFRKPRREERGFPNQSVE